jgi:hypothetical protein
MSAAVWRSAVVVKPDAGERGLMLRVVTGLCSSFLILSTAQSASAVSEVVNLTFEPCGGMICLPVTLADGRSHVLLLDTGNVNSWLVADTARTLGLRLDPIAQDGKVVAGIFRLGGVASGQGAFRQIPRTRPGTSG